MKPVASIRIILVDDHVLVREGMEGVLRKHNDLHVVASVDSGAEAIVACRENEVDVVLLDLKLRDMDGIETLRRLREVHPNLAIVMLTSDERQVSVRRAMEAGASGFLPKSIRSWDLVQAVRQVARRGRLPLAANLAAPSGSAEEPARLTDRELSVLKQLASGASNEEIADAIGISGNTVKTHLTRILDKLGANTRTEAVVEAVRSGVIDLD